MIILITPPNIVEVHVRNRRAELLANRPNFTSPCGRSEVSQRDISSLVTSNSGRRLEMVDEIKP